MDGGTQLHVVSSRSVSTLDTPIGSDGSWMPGNQLLTIRQWSEPIANQSTTMWAAIALAAYNAPEHTHPVTVEKSVAWQQAQPLAGDNYEWLATRLLFEKHFGCEKNIFIVINH